MKYYHESAVGLHVDDGAVVQVAGCKKVLVEEKIPKKYI